MGTFQRFEDIEAWQLARTLAREVFEATKEAAFSKDYELKNQILRSSGSVMDNIAEGFGRGGRNEFVAFLGHSVGPCNEVQSQLHSSFDRHYITQNQFDSLYKNADMINAKLGALIRYLNQSDIKEVKFKNRV